MNITSMYDSIHSLVLLSFPLSFVFFFFNRIFRWSSIYYSKFRGVFNTFGFLEPIVTKSSTFVCVYLASIVSCTFHCIFLSESQQFVLVSNFLLDWQCFTYVCILPHITYIWTVHFNWKSHDSGGHCFAVFNIDTKQNMHWKPLGIDLTAIPFVTNENQFHCLHNTCRRNVFNGYFQN